MFVPYKITEHEYPQVDTAEIRVYPASLYFTPIEVDELLGTHEYSE